MVFIHNIPNTVKSRYLELGYLKFCETRSVYLNQKYILIAVSNHNVALDLFLQVQITRSANQCALRVIWICKKYPHNIDISRVDCIQKYIYPLVFEKKKWFNNMSYKASFHIYSLITWCLLLFLFRFGIFFWG